MILRSRAVAYGGTPRRSRRAPGRPRRVAVADTVEFRDRHRSVLLDKLRGGPNTAEVRRSFADTAARLHGRQFEPYPPCAAVCSQDPPLCLYRSAVSGLVSNGRYRESWLEADAADARFEDNRRRQTWEVRQDAATS
jgi:hypothetical protein